ncbi:hypothetical protein M2436_005041 [Streptomyces sp. HB372]|nr:hypothetical protein [Streptomyces sp. HB372]
MVTAAAAIPVKVRPLEPRGAARSSGSPASVSSTQSGVRVGGSAGAPDGASASKASTNSRRGPGTGAPGGADCCAARPSAARWAARWADTWRATACCRAAASWGPAG